MSGESLAIAIDNCDVIIFTQILPSSLGGVLRL